MKQKTFLPGTLVAAIVVCTSSSAPFQVAAQDAATGDSPLGSHFEIGAGLRYDFNPEQDPGGTNTKLGLITSLDYRLGWETSTSRLGLKLGGDVNFGGQSNGLTDPNLLIDYAHTASRTRFNTQLSYVESDVSSVRYSEASDGRTIVATGKGDVAQTRLGFGVEGGVDMPLSYKINAGYRDVRYSNVTAGSFDDNETLNGDVQVAARLSPMTTVFLDGAHETYTEDDADNTRRESQTARISVAQRIDRITVARASLGYKSVALTSLAGDQNSDGLTATLSVRRDHRGGQSVLRYNRDIQRNGTWQTLKLSRENNLKSGQFNWSLGVVDSAEGNMEFIGDLTYRMETKRDLMAFSLERKLGVSGDAEEQLSHRASFFVDHALDDKASIEFNLSATALSAPSGDDTALDARIAYQRDLDRNLGLETGMRFRVVDDAGTDRAVSGSVFLTLSRTFERK